MAGLLNSPEFSSIPPKSWLLTCRHCWPCKFHPKSQNNSFSPLSPLFQFLTLSSPQFPPHPSHTYHTSPPPYLTISSIWNPPQQRLPPQHFVFIASLDFASLTPLPPPNTPLVLFSTPHMDQTCLLLFNHLVFPLLVSIFLPFQTLTHAILNNSKLPNMTPDTRSPKV